MTGDTAQRRRGLGSQRPLADAGGKDATSSGARLGLQAPGALLACASSASAGRATPARAEGASRVRNPGLPHPVPCIRLSTPEHIVEQTACLVFLFFFFRKPKCLYS